MTSLEAKAVALATKAHAGQMYGDFPYLYHLMAVHRVATESNQSTEILVACILHDILEDSEMYSYENLSEEFGEEIAGIVLAVTDAPGPNRNIRKLLSYNKIRANPKAIIVKYCDRVANVRESFLRNKTKYEMYLKEMPQFLEQLQIPNNSIARLREELLNYK